jgi:malonyl-CoA/methylmalonyl-CoA synthetase
MLAVAALARATASHAYAYGARRLGAPAAGAARAVSSRACAVSRDAAPGGNNADAGEALAARLRAVAAATPDRVAVVTPGGEEVTFGSLLAHAERVAGSLRAAAVASTRTDGDDPDGDDPDTHAGDDDVDVLRGARVAVSAVPGAEFVAAVHAAWLCGAIAVPIARGHSLDETAYVLKDAGVAVFALVPESREPDDPSPAPELRVSPAAASAGEETDDAGPSGFVSQSHVGTRPTQLAGAGEHAAALEAMEAAGTRAMVLVPPAPKKKKVSRPSRAVAETAKEKSLDVAVGTRDSDATRSETIKAIGFVSPTDGALIIYTSGTTGSPKGVLHTHASLYAQCASLCEAWAWRPDDRVYHCLPLHHIHGIVNALLCAHFAGACVEFAPISPRGFAPRTTWSRLRDGTDGSKPPVTVFMGVPTMYVMLLRALAGAAEARPREAAASAAAARALRLAVSGSAACPEPVMREWERLTGAETLLERYGMTETGMVLSNPLTPASARVPGTVGAPLPGVQTKLAPLEEEIASSSAPSARETRATSDETRAKKNGEKPGGPGSFGSPGFDPKSGPGELLVRGPGVFARYWNRPEATSAAFAEDGFFRTGDAVEAADEKGDSWRVLGRVSADILKTGGFKVSALEVEAKLLEHPRVREVSVVGVPDDAYGEVGVAVAALESDGAERNTKENDEEKRKRADAEASALRAWARGRMAEYKVPRAFIFVEAIPRNAMGKVNKKSLRAELDLLSGGD